MTRMSEKMIAASISVAYRSIGCNVRVLAIAGVRQQVKKSCCAFASWYSGRYLPACRITHIGGRGTCSPEDVDDLSVVDTLRKVLRPWEVGWEAVVPQRRTSSSAEEQIILERRKGVGRVVVLGLGDFGVTHLDLAWVDLRASVLYKDVRADWEAKLVTIRCYQGGVVLEAYLPRDTRVAS